MLAPTLRVPGSWTFLPLREKTQMKVESLDVVTSTRQHKSSFMVADGHTVKSVTDFNGQKQMLAVTEHRRYNTNKKHHLMYTTEN